MIDELRPYPAYRDSDTPWLGNVPDHWKLDRAKWLFEKMDRPTDLDDDVVTCFRDGVVTLRKNRRVRGFTESLKEIGYQGVRRGDLVIHQMDGFAGAIGVSDSNGKCTPVYSVCHPRGDINPYYYAHVVREMARSQWIAALAKGIRERSTDFRFEGFAPQLLPIPPRCEQNHIAAFIDHADRRIRRYIRDKQRLIRLLEEQKQVIIHRAVTRGLDPNVRLKPSGVEWLGEVPQHWEIMSLGAGAQSIQTGPFGSQLHASEYVLGGTPVINPSHMRDGQVCFDPAVSVDSSKAEQLKRHSLQAGDIVAARRGELGRCALVREAEAGWLCGTGSVRVRPRHEVFASAYLLQVFGSQGVRDMLTMASIGATMDNLNAGMVARIRLPSPPLPEQAEILAHVSAESEAVRSATDLATREIALLREYRTHLIADVVTGKLDVRVAALGLPDEVDELDVLGETGDVSGDDDVVDGDLDGGTHDDQT